MKCFNYHKENMTSCLNKKCRYWIEESNNQNCCVNLIEAKKTMTLEEIGNIFKVTRMRICQIEKRAVQKIKDKLFQIT